MSARGWRRLGDWAGDILRRRLRSPLERERDFYRRYRELSRRIEHEPGNATVHLLRGELSLERGDWERAKADLEAAVKLAEDRDDGAGWRIVEQVLRDRARHGMELATRRLEPSERRINLEA